MEVQLGAWSTDLHRPLLEPHKATPTVLSSPGQAAWRLLSPKCLISQGC